MEHVAGRDRQEPGAEKSGRDRAGDRAALGHRDEARRADARRRACMRRAWSSATAIFPNTSRSPARTTARSSRQYAMGPLTDVGMLKMRLPRAEDADGDHGCRGADSPAHAGFRYRHASRSTTRRPSTCSTAARRSRSSNWNPAAWSAGLPAVRHPATSRISTRILALYRPGPMDLIPDYIKRKKGLAKIKYAAQAARKA